MASDEQIEKVKSYVHQIGGGEWQPFAAVLAELAVLRTERTAYKHDAKVDAERIDRMASELTDLRELRDAVRKFGNDCHYSMGEASGAWNRIVEPELAKCK